MPSQVKKDIMIKKSSFCIERERVNRMLDRDKSAFKLQISIQYNQRLGQANSLLMFKELMIRLEQTNYLFVRASRLVE